MGHRLIRAALLGCTALALGCLYSFDPPPGSVILCSPTGAKCPGSWQCAPALGRCVAAGTAVEVAEVRVSPSGPLGTTEGGGAAALAVTLGAQPTSLVRIPISSTSTTEVQTSPAELSFTATSWNQPQTVTVQSVADHVIDGDKGYEVVFGVPLTDDTRFSGLSEIRIAGTNADVDVAQILCSPAEVRTSETPGSPIPVLVTLSSKPSAPVTIPVSVNLPGEASVAPASVTIQPAAWNQPALVLLSGVDDSPPMADGDKDYVIQLGPAVSSDANFDGGTLTVPGKNDDDESPGVTVTPTAGLATSEGGGPASFAVRLRTSPAAPVTVTFHSLAPTEALFSTGVDKMVTFDSGNWNVDQTVLVYGQNDAVVDGAKPFTIQSDDAASTDPVYNGYDVPNVTGMNADNDNAGFNVAILQNTVNELGGLAAQYTLSLTSAPQGTVTVNILSGLPNRASPAPASVQLTAQNWQTGASFSIFGVDNSDRDGDQFMSVSFSGGIAPQDPAYQGLVAPSASAMVADDERIIFTTEGQFTGDLKQLGGPDVICANDPVTSRSDGPFNPVKAFIAYTDGFAGQRVASMTGDQGDGQVNWVLSEGHNYVRDSRDGPVVARVNGKNLFNFPLEGESFNRTGPAWTGMRPDWTRGEDCSAWESGLPFSSGKFGADSSVDRDAISVAESALCSEPHHLVCVEQ